MLCGQFLRAQEGGKAEWTDFRDDQDVGLRTMEWGSSSGLLPALIGYMGQGGRFVVLDAAPI